MPRGSTSPEGTVMVSANGYSYTKHNGKTRLTHHIIAEQTLGRPVNTETELIRFKNGDKTDLSPGNIEVIPKNKASVRKRLAVVEARIAEYEAEREYLLKQLGGE
jgi:hypothetical protein